MELIGKKILKDLVDRKIGYGIVQPGQNVDNGIPVIKVNNIISGLSDVNLLDKTTVENSNKYKRTLLQGGELLISLVGSVGKTAIVPKSFSGCNLVRATGLIDIKNPLICKWTKYFIDSKYGQTYINNNLNTTVQPTLNIDSLEKMEIPFFQKEYMEKAVNILHSLDDKIELNNKINENLEQQAQALFKNWFADFEPFGGKMPEGWKVGKLSDIAEITSGKRPPMKQSDFSKDVSIPLVGAASVMGYTNQVLYNEPILITGRVGTHGVIQRFSTECWPSDNTLVVKSQYYEYVYQIMCNIDYDNMNRGSTQPLITQSDLGKVECIIPDEENLNKFEQLTNNLFAKGQENELENQKLSNIRDTLLPKLMNGEIEVDFV